MNSAKSMFWFRFRNEWSENKRLVGVMWLLMAAMSWSFFSWWFGEPSAGDDVGSVAGGFAVLGLALLGLMLVTTAFKRDDLKNPEDFWATRPIRALPLFGAKLAFVQAVFTLPLGLLMTSFSLSAGTGGVAFLYGFELMLWLIFLTTVLALSCMANSGGTKSLLCALVLAGAIMVTTGVLASKGLGDWLQRFMIEEHRMRWNGVVALVVLTSLMVFLAIRQMRNKHAHTRMGWFAFAGFFTVLFVAYVPLPGTVTSWGKSETISAGKPATALTFGDTSEISPNVFTSGLTSGTESGARFISCNGNLALSEAIGHEGVTYIKGCKLDVQGADGVICRAEANGVRLWSGDDNSNARIHSLDIQFKTFDRMPGNSGSSSSGYRENLAEMIKSLPLKKVRVTGNVTLQCLHYRTISRCPVDQALELRGKCFSLKYIPDASGLETWVNPGSGLAMYACFSPPLLTATDGERYFRENFRMRFEHPEGTRHSQFSDQREITGSGRRSDGPFGRTSVTEIRMNQSNLSYFWMKLRESGYDKSFAEWRKDAVLVFDTLESTRYITIPVDAEAEVPDPEKLRELLTSDKLNID